MKISQGIWTAITSLYNSQPQAVHLKTTFHVLCCVLLSQIKLLFRLYPHFSMYLIYPLITSWECLIISHMSSSFTTEKQSSLFIQSDKKTWELHRKHAKRLIDIVLASTCRAKDPTVLSKSPGLSGEKLPLMWITTGSLTKTRAVTWVLPSNFSPRWWKKILVYT